MTNVIKQLETNMQNALTRYEMGEDMDFNQGQYAAYRMALGLINDFEAHQIEEENKRYGIVTMAN